MGVRKRQEEEKGHPLLGKKISTLDQDAYGHRNFDANQWFK